MLRICFVESLIVNARFGVLDFPEKINKGVKQSSDYYCKIKTGQENISK